jgi:hypothetical protein
VQDQTVKGPTKGTHDANTEDCRSIESRRTDPSDSSNCAVGDWIWGRCASGAADRETLTRPRSMFFLPPRASA